MAWVPGDPLITNATASVRRDGVSGYVAAGFRAHVKAATYIAAPEGPRREQRIYVRLSLGILGADYLDIVGDSGATKTGIVTFVDDVEGMLGYTILVVDGGLLPT